MIGGKYDNQLPPRTKKEGKGGKVRVKKCSQMGGGGSIIWISILIYIHPCFRPPAPIQDTYSMFGVTINNNDAIIQSLESQVNHLFFVQSSSFISAYRIRIMKKIRIRIRVAKNKPKIHIKINQNRYLLKMDPGFYLSRRIEIN